MSYKSDKNKMNKQLNDKKDRLAFIIKITFVALFVSLIALIIRKQQTYSSMLQKNGISNMDRKQWMVLSTLATGIISGDV